MLSENKLSLLHQLIENTTTEELVYSKGFIDGYLLKLDKGNTSVLLAEKPVTIAIKPHIVYATETGNSKKVATQLLKSFKNEKIQAKSTDISQFSIEKLQKEEYVLFVISTQGEGELPETAQNFYIDLKNSEINLEKLNYAVFGLGDSSYPLFCSAGILLDEALAEKKANRILPLVKADVNYNDLVSDWGNQLKNQFKNKTNNNSVAFTPQNTVVSAPNHRKNYTGVISHKVVLNDTGSNKKTYHIEITPNEEVFYEPGDSLGIIPINRDADVDAVLQFFKTNKTEVVKIKDKEKTIEQWLKTLNIKGIGKNKLNEIAKTLQIENIWDKADLVDLLSEAKKDANIELSPILEILLPIAPRLYSISSSKEAHDGQIHLTVNLNQFFVNEIKKTGLASGHLSEFPLDTEFQFYIDKNNNFKLPEDEKDIILIGPGTGIAPFRSFLAERDYRGAEGKNWLFFGEQHFVYDFYYQTEVQEWLSTGALSKLSTAFSRDQEKKIYVQDRIKQEAKNFIEWLDNGAYLYICGQKLPMSVDVENTILEILEKEKKLSPELAKEYLENLEEAGRYHKDVY